MHGNTTVCVPAFGCHGSGIHAPNATLKLSFLKGSIYLSQGHIIYSILLFLCHFCGFGRPLIVKYIFPVAAILKIQNGHLAIICANANIDFWIQ